MAFASRGTTLCMAREITTGVKVEVARKFTYSVYRAFALVWIPFLVANLGQPCIIFRMTINTIADIAGDGAKHAIGTPSQQARRIWLTSLTGASRFGDANVAAGRGVALTEGVECVFAASDSDATDVIWLDQAFVFVPNGDTVTVAWGS